MNSPQPATRGRNWTRLLVNALVALVVIAVAGAAFTFSYAGVHAIALLGGVSAQLARYYPGLFDAVLVIACVAAVMLRDGRWWARLWAWLVIIVVLGAIGSADVLHAADYTLRHRLTEGIVAAAPVAAVLLAFSLLLTMLRQTRPAAPSPAVAAPLDVPALPAAVSAPPVALPAAPDASPAVAAAVPVEPHDVVAEPTVPVQAIVVAPATVPVPVPEDSPLPGAAPTQPEPVPAGVQEAPQDAVPDDAAPADGDTVAQETRTPTEPSEIIPEAAPTVAAALPDEPAPPTVVIPAVTPSPAPTRSQGIRYAGRGAYDTPPSPDYWEADDTAQFGGLVYPARDDTGADDAPADGPAARQDPPELDDDAPPFATAPFAPVPRLNRVRSMPAPPADENE